MLDREKIEQEFNYCLDKIISKIENKTATEIVSIEQPLILLFNRLINEIEKLERKINKILNELDWIDDDMIKCCSMVDVNGIDIVKILKEE